MAAGDRYKNGRPKDIVRHAKSGDGVICGIKSAGYSTYDHNDVTCKRCLGIIKVNEKVLSVRPNNWASMVW